MPFRDAETHLRDILEASAHIEHFVADMDFDSYRADEKTKAAVERKIQTLTEAVIRLEADGPREHLPIDWKAYRGLGNLLRHCYHRIDDQIVWNTAKQDIPSLRRIVEQALRASEPETTA